MVKGASDVGVAQLSLRIDDPNGEYVNLKEAEVQIVDDFNNGLGDSDLVVRSSRCWLVWWWARLIILLIFVGVLAAVFFKWVGPFVMDKVCTHDTYYVFVCLCLNACQFRLFDEMPASALFLLCAFCHHLLLIFLNASLLSSHKCHCTLQNEHGMSLNLMRW